MSDVIRGEDGVGVEVRRGLRVVKRANPLHVSAPPPTDVFVV